METIPTISEWLTGKNILVTGGTGYIGKLLIEKILRCCPKVHKIYILLRAKKGRTIQDRFQDILNSSLWTIIKFDYDFSKLVPIQANFSTAGIEISEENIKILRENVNIVFHGAASIRFTDSFDQAIKANTRFTYEMVTLAKTMKNLDIFVQISTAYVNCDKTVIEEIVYPAKMDWRKAIQLAETADIAEIDAVTEAAIGELPNTYTFSKNLAEHVVWDHREEIPILIHRPVVVTCLAREPTTGWSDKLSGVEVSFYAVGKGLIRIVGYPKDIKTNMCPGDVTVNGLLIATWKKACHSKVTGQPAASVVHSNFFNTPVGEIFEYGKQALNEEPIGDAIWREYHFHVTNQTLFLVLHLIFNVMPALVIQYAVQIITGKKLTLTKYLRTYYTLLMLVTHFKKSFYMATDNIYEAVSVLSAEDKVTYDISILREGETYVDVFKRCAEWFRILQKEKDLPLKERLRQRKMRFLIDKICRVILLVVVVYYFPYQLLFNCLKIY